MKSMGVVTSGGMKFEVIVESLSSVVDVVSSGTHLLIIYALGQNVVERSVWEAPKKGKTTSHGVHSLGIVVAPPPRERGKGNYGEEWSFGSGNNRGWGIDRIVKSPVMDTSLVQGDDKQTCEDVVAAGPTVVVTNPVATVGHHDYLLNAHVNSLQVIADDEGDYTTLSLAAVMAYQR